MVIAVVVGYGPSIVWMWFASRRWGTGHVFGDLGVRFRWVDLGWGPLIWIGTVAAMGVAIGLMRVLDVPYRGNLDVDNGSPFERDNTAIAALLVVRRGLRADRRGGAVPRRRDARAAVEDGGGAGDRHPGACCSALPTSIPTSARESIGLIIALSVAGVGFGLGCYLLRRLGPVIIAHAVMNAVAITVVT